MNKMLERPKTQPEINLFRRESLMDAAIQAVAEKGIASATIANICSAAGVSRGLANHYFDGKEDLLCQAYERLLDSVIDVTTRAAQKHPDDALERLKAIVAAIFEAEILTETNRKAYHNFWTASLANDRLKDINRTSRARESRAMEHQFKEIKKQKGLFFDAKSAALSLIAVIDGCWLALTLSEANLTASQATDMCQTQIEMLIAFGKGGVNESPN